MEGSPHTPPTPVSNAEGVRIVIYSDDPGEGGVAQYNVSLASGLAALGYSVTVAQSKRESATVTMPPTVGQRWIPFDTRLEPARNLTDVKVAADLLDALNPTLVIFTNCAPLSQVAATLAAANRGVPFIIVEGFVAPYSILTAHQAWMLHFQRLLYEKARAVVAVSGDNLAILRSHFGLHKRKGEVVHYGRPASFFAARDPMVRATVRKELGIPLDATVCLTAARFSDVKGFPLQLQAFRCLADRTIWERLAVIWAGDGPLLETMRQAVIDAGLSEKIKFLGHRSDVASLLDASDVFILPSYHEGMPLAITEAMAKGLAVAATSVSGIPEQLGATGCLLPDPKVDSNATVAALAKTLEEWAEQPSAMRDVGLRCRERAAGIFREDMMLERMRDIVQRALLPAHDYVSPGMKLIQPDAAFPDLAVASRETLEWEYLRDEIPHANYIDRRVPGTGFLNRDEATLLHTISALFSGRRALEVGCWLGWSAAHMAAGGVELDVIDPVLSNPAFHSSVVQSLATLGLIDRVTLHAAASPSAIDTLGKAGRRWSLFFIDGNHSAPYPLYDTAVAIEYAEPDAAVVFHDLVSPEVAQAIEYLHLRGWNVRIFHTAQIMGMAWRGAVTPPVHVADPAVGWHVPKHLRQFVSGEELSGLLC